VRAHLVLLVVVACTTTTPPPTACNGHAELCSRTYDAVAYPGTHDAYASVANGVMHADQTYSLTRQLADGIRVLHFEILPDNGEPFLCHTICGLGGESLVDALTEVTTFLDATTNQVVTLLTESSEITTDQIASAFETASALHYTQAHTLGQPWPTLGTMIQNGERLVVFHADVSSTGGTVFDWMLDRFSWTWETPWDNETATDFGRCNADRGTMGNAIYVVDNYLEDLPNDTPVNAALVNDNPFLVDRVLYCQMQESRLPNFVMVDYYEVGNVFQDVDVLNGLAPPNADVAGFPPSSFDGGTE